MTCLVGIKTDKAILIGADSAISCPSGLVETNFEKTVRKGRFVYAGAGDARTVQLVFNAFKEPNCPSGLSAKSYLIGPYATALKGFLEKHGCLEEQSMSAEFIVTFRGELFTICGNFCIVPAVNGFVSIGAGQQVALGALYASAKGKPEDRVLLALEAASHFIEGCRGPYTVLKV